MKPFYTPLAIFSLLLGLLMTGGCLKDHCSHSSIYKVYTPQYVSLSTVRQAVKSEAPRPISHIGKIFYHNGYLFLGEVNQGIHVIDDRNLSSPKNIAFIQIPGNLDMAVKDNILYADSYVDMLAIDISDPSAIRVAQRVDNVFPSRYYGVGFQDDPQGLGLITGFSSKDSTIDQDCDISLNKEGYYYDVGANQSMVPAHSTSAPPSGLPLAGSAGGSTARFSMLDHYLYTLSGDSLALYNIAQSAHPLLVNRLRLGSNVETLFSYSSSLFMGTSSGMLIYDASNPAAPVYKGRFDHLYACDPVVVQGTYAYVTLREGTACGSNNVNEADVVDISNPAAPRQVSSLPLSNPYGLGIDGHQLIVADGKAGIRFIDATDPASLSIKKTIGGVNARDVIALNGFVLVVASDGLYQYDDHDFSNPKWLSTLGTSSK